jgi:hypothetical protein
MKRVLTACAVVLALGAVTTAEAGLFGSRKFPKPIDSPIIRPRVKEYHKPGTRVKHLMDGGMVDATVPSDVARG